MENVKDIDGNSYKTVIIGDQIWMAENLKVTRYQNGDPIPFAQDYSDWTFTSKGAYCNPHNNESNVKTYGRLYNWYSINDIRGLAPKGWHIPKPYEWDELITYLGGKEIASGKLKSIGTIENGDGLWDLWESTTKKYEATNEYGFNAVPSGCRSGARGDFDRLGNVACFWSTSEDFDYDSIRQDLNKYAPSNIEKTALKTLGPADAWSYIIPPGPLVIKFPMQIQTGMSIRCLKD
jgi:uncharacterized protein (TIGR02145 family)